MVFNKICPPALIYLIFSLTHIGIDTFKGLYNTAFAKIWVALIFTVVLNFLCSRGLGIISWFIVFIPFVLMTLIISILLYIFGLDPSTGRLKIYAPPNEFRQDMASYGVPSVPEVPLPRMDRPEHLIPGTGPPSAVPATPGAGYNDYYNQRDNGRRHHFGRGGDKHRDHDRGRFSDQSDRQGCITMGGRWCFETSKCIAPHRPCSKKHHGGHHKPSSNIGGDTDTHGCLSGAGYSWCSALGKCVGPNHPCKKKKKNKKEGFAWPTITFPTFNVATPIVKWPSLSFAADTGSIQFPIPTAVALGCLGKC